MTNIPENVKTWLEALRSGKYQQTERTLKLKKGDELSYCCLGVYCEINGIEVEPVNDAGESEGPDAIYEILRNNLTDEVVDVGVELNDKGESFKSIADIIEGMILNKEVFIYV